MVKPEVCRLTGYALAGLIYDNHDIDMNQIRDFIEYPHDELKVSELYSCKIEPEENVLVVGFAETATGLGMATASAIKNAYYVTTTREPITDVSSCFDFEETHSHATSHQCFLKDVSRLNAEHIILVDDEITTGNTMLHLIESLERNLPKGNRRYSVVSILDWRNDTQLEKYEQFCKTHNIQINTYALITGVVESDDHRVFTDGACEKLTETMDVTPLNIFERTTHQLQDGTRKSYLAHSGRFGVCESDFRALEHHARNAYLKLVTEDDSRLHKKLLILGHGENIYLPSRVAARFPNAEFKTTSRSPIFISEENNYPIKEKHSFMFENTTYYFYDKHFIEDYYDEVILLVEDDMNIKLCENQKTYKL